MEIEDIMMRNQQLILENEALRQQIEDLKNGFEGSCMACEPVGEMNKKLRDELTERIHMCDMRSERILELTTERDAALSVVNEFISDTTFKNQTPDHECEFKYSPETGKCDACEAWGNYIGLFCSREDEEENTR